MDAAGLARDLGRFDASLPLEEASTPPSTWYTEPGFYELERETVFRRNWIVAANAHELREPGRFVTGEAAGERFVLARGTDGILRAFANVCRHRATGVASGCGSAERFICPYHGWTYGLDGRLLQAPELGGVKGFDRERSGLHPLACAEWGALVFVALGEPAWELHAGLAELDRRLRESGSFDLRFVERRSYDLGCNWKVFVDNYLDGGYHVPALHPGLASELDLGSYRTELFGRFSIQSSAGAPEAGRIGQRTLYAWIYPNLMINRYGSIMDTNWVLPLGPSATRVVIDFFFAEIEGEKAKSFIEESIRTSHRIQLEDVAISESVQRGLGSGYFDRGRYSVKRQMGEHHFHGLLAADLAGKRIAS